MPGAGGHQVGDGAGVVRAVQHQQPARVRVAAAQRVAHGAQPFAVLDAGGEAERGGEFGQALAQRAAGVGRDPPHHVVGGAEAVHVLGRRLGLADARHAEQGDHGGAGVGLRQPLVDGLEGGLAAGEADVAARHAAPHARLVVGEAGAGAQADGGGGVRFPAVQAEQVGEPAVRLAGADAPQFRGAAERRDGGRQRGGGDGDGGESALVGRHHGAQCLVPLLGGTRAHLEVPVAEDHQHPALGEQQVAERLHQRDLGGRIPALEGDVAAVLLQPVGDPGGPGPVEPGEADGDPLPLGGCGPAQSGHPTAPLRCGTDPRTAPSPLAVRQMLVVFRLTATACQGG